VCRDARRFDLRSDPARCVSEGDAMSVLVVYFMLMRSGAFEVVSIERNRDADYCTYLAQDLDKVFDGKIGNIVVVCTEDKGFEL
jgi:hypothetical protein